MSAAWVRVDIHDQAVFDRVVEENVRAALDVARERLSEFLYSVNPNCTAEQFNAAMTRLLADVERIVRERTISNLLVAKGSITH